MSLIKQKVRFAEVSRRFKSHIHGTKIAYQVIFVYFARYALNKNIYSNIKHKKEK